MARVSLASPLETRAGNNTKDSRAINGILEAAGEQAGVIKRPGSSSVGSVTSGTSQLLSEFNSKTVTVIGDSLKVNTVSPFGTDSTTALVFRSTVTSNTVSTGNSTTRTYQLVISLQQR